MNDEIHEAIILDLAIRALRLDLDNMQHLKMKTVYERWMNQRISLLERRKKEVEHRLQSRRSFIIGYRKINTYFCSYEVISDKKRYEIRYSIVQLKRETEKILIQQSLLNKPS
ncbi:MAG TPA: hypothetical protein VIG63_01790 [Savagea sp.]